MGRLKPVKFSTSKMVDIKFFKNPNELKKQKLKEQIKEKMFKAIYVKGESNLTKYITSFAELEIAIEIAEEIIEKQEKINRLGETK